MTPWDDDISFDDLMLDNGEAINPFEAAEIYDDVRDNTFREGQ